MAPLILSAKCTSGVPPPCCHLKPPPFCCPKDGCPPMQQYPLRCRPYSAPCSPLICRPRPCPPCPPPTICIAGPCSMRPCRIKYECPTPRLQAPASCVQFCIRYTCEGSTFAPCYSSSMPNCMCVGCC